MFAWRYDEKRLPTFDCCGESFDRVPLQIVSNRPVWSVVDRHPDRSPESDGLLRHPLQGLMDIGVLRERGVEIDAKNLLNTNQSRHENRRG